MATDSDVGICFDQAYQVRVLDASKYEATQRLQRGCSTLTSKVEQLNVLVKTYLEVLDSQADKIEMQKLKAIGVRNAVATLEEDKKRILKEAQAQLSDKQQRLERLEIQERSLLRAKQEQETLIAKLTYSSMQGTD